MENRIVKLPARFTLRTLMVGVFICCVLAWIGRAKLRVDSSLWIAKQAATRRLDELNESDELQWMLHSPLKLSDYKRTFYETEKDGRDVIVVRYSRRHFFNVKGDVNGFRINVFPDTGKSKTKSWLDARDHLRRKITVLTSISGLIASR